MCGDGAFVLILVRMGGEWEVAIDELRDLDDGRGSPSGRGGHSTAETQRRRGRRRGKRE